MFVSTAFKLFLLKRVKFNRFEYNYSDWPNGFSKIEIITHDYVFS